MRVLEEERASTLKAFQDDYHTLKTRVETQVDKLNSRNDAVQKKVATYSQEMDRFCTFSSIYVYVVSSLDGEKGLVLGEYKKAISRIKKKK